MEEFFFGAGGLDLGLFRGDVCKNMLGSDRDVFLAFHRIVFRDLTDQQGDAHYKEEHFVNNGRQWA